jgi:hypothetical protein
MKLFPKKIRGTDPDKGYLSLKGTTLDYGYQKHGASTVLVMPLMFMVKYVPWLCLDILKPFVQNNFGAALVASIYAYLIGWFIEYMQKWFFKDRVFDPWDAHIMLIFALIFSMSTAMLTVLTTALGL